MLREHKTQISLFTGLALVWLAFSQSAVAESKKPRIQLMRLSTASVIERSYSKRKRPRLALSRVNRRDAQSQSQARVQPERRNELRSGFGFEMGTVGRKSISASEVFGMHYLLGGRLLGHVPLSRYFAVSPSVGYYFNSTGPVGARVYEHQVQAGLDFFFAPGQTNAIRWMAGLAQRGDMFIAETSTFLASHSSDPIFRYRFGPTTALSFRLGGTLRLRMQAELTFEPAEDFHPYAGFSIGLLFGS